MSGGTVSASRIPASKPWPRTSDQCLLGGDLQFNTRVPLQIAQEQWLEQHCGGATGRVDAEPAGYLAAAFARIFERTIDHYEALARFPREFCNGASAPLEGRLLVQPAPAAEVRLLALTAR
jgi:hypothetical protein